MESPSMEKSTFNNDNSIVNNVTNSLKLVHTSEQHSIYYVSTQFYVRNYKLDLSILPEFL